MLEAFARMAPCPVCGSPVEPEMDGDLRYYECEADGCEAGGYAFGFQKVASGEAECQLGIPEAVRKAGPVEKRPVPLGQTIRLRPGL